MHIKKLLLALAAVASLASGASHANLVVNGDFEQTSNGVGQFDAVTQLNGWSSSGYNFVFSGSTADSSGANGIYGNLSLWGPQNGAANGLGASPTGGNFVGADGAFQVASIQQMISGLVVGRTYDLSFNWGAAQQFGFDGDNTEKWIVSFGNQSQETITYQNVNHGFSGWMSETFSFVASGSDQMLSFLAEGTPQGVPPFSLLDSVSLVERANVPEPTTWTMMVAGFGLLAFSLRRRKDSAV